MRRLALATAIAGAFLFGVIVDRALADPRSAPVIPASHSFKGVVVEPDRELAEAPRAPVAPQFPAPTVAASHGRRLSGIRATWYCNATHPEVRRSPCTAGHPDVAGEQLLAAVTPDLARLRGHLLEVCRGALCVTVRAIDCDCRTTHSIDLYADAAARLDLLSRGWGWVSLEVVGG